MLALAIAFPYCYAIGERIGLQYVEEPTSEMAAMFSPDPSSDMKLGTLAGTSEAGDEENGGDMGETLQDSQPDAPVSATASVETV